MGRWAIFVHEPDGDMGEGYIVGPFTDVDAADEKAHKIQARRADVEAIVLPVTPATTGVKAIAEKVGAP